MAEIRSLQGEVLFSDPAAQNPVGALQGALAQGVSLAGADLSGLDLTGISFRETDLRGASLRAAKLREARFTDCDLAGADLTDAQGRGVRAVGSSFAGARLQRADLSAGVFARSSFSKVMAGGFNDRGENLGANFKETHFTECSLTRAQVGGVGFAGAEMDACDANGWSAGRTDFTGAVINASDMRSAHMRRAVFRDAEIANSKLDNSDMRDSDLKGVRMAVNTMTDSVLTHSTIHEGRFMKVDMTGVRANKSRVSSNIYDRCEGLPAEMQMDRGGDRVAKAMAKGLSYASLGGAFVGGFLLAPDSFTQGLTDNQMVGRGAAGIATMAGANMVMRKLAPVIEKEVIGRIERVLTKAAPGVSRAAASIPLADLAHRYRNMEFAAVTGMNERRVGKLIEIANKQDPQRDASMRATGVIAANDDTQIIVARDKDSMGRMQDLLAKGKDRVVILRLDDQGRPRETGPALYEFRRDGSMTSVWFHKGAPDFAAQFDGEGNPLRHRAFSARDRMTRSESETIHTKVLSRRETTQEEAVSWLNSGQAGEEVRTAIGQGQGLAVSMRETGHFLRAARDYIETSHPEAATRAGEISEQLEQTNPGRSDRTAPDVWPKTARQAAKVMDETVDALGALELKGLARIGGRLGETLRGQIAEFTEAKKASRDENAGAAGSPGSGEIPGRAAGGAGRKRKPASQVEGAR